MTPKEKANEIFSKMHNEVYESYGTEIGFISKQCALIAVDEIISLNIFDYYESDRKIRIEYWQEVKQELENL
jgi:hypothetical protein